MFGKVRNPMPVNDFHLEKTMHLLGLTWYSKRATRVPSLHPYDSENRGSPLKISDKEHLPFQSKRTQVRTHRRKYFFFPRL